MSLRSPLRLGKKGASLDNIWVAVVFFGLAIMFMTLMIMWNALADEATDLWTGSSKGAEIKRHGQAAVNQFDWILVMVWVGFHLGILVTAYLLKSHPVIYVAAILIIAIIAMIAAPLSNAWHDMKSNTDLATAITSLKMTSFVLDNFPKFEVIWGFITVVVMFGLARSEGFF